MFSFYPPLSFSLSLAFSFSLSLFLSLSLFISAPLFLSVVARHMSSDALYQIFSSWSILLFHTISFHSSYKILQLFTDYLLRLPSSELLEKHLFRSRANHRLVWFEHHLFTWLSWNPHGKFWRKAMNILYKSLSHSFNHILNVSRPHIFSLMIWQLTCFRPPRGWPGVAGSTARMRWCSVVRRPVANIPASRWWRRQMLCLGWMDDGFFGQRDGVKLGWYVG